MIPMLPIMRRRTLDDDQSQLYQYQGVSVNENQSHRRRRSMWRHPQSKPREPSPAATITRAESPTPTIAVPYADPYAPYEPNQSSYDNPFDTPFEQQPLRNPYDLGNPYGSHLPSYASARNSIVRHGGGHRRSARTQSQEVWYPDGDLVILAGTTVFKVISAVLVAQSKALREIAVGKGVVNAHHDLEEEYEGLRLVRIVGNPTELEVFLQAMHDPEYLDTNSTLRFSAIAGILRFSARYQVTHLRNRAIARLLDAYPTTLSRWDEPQYAPILGASTVGTTGSFAALNLARELDIPQILPAVIYSCAIQPSSTILDGVPSSSASGGGDVHLSADDKKVCVIAKEKLYLARNKKTFAFLRMRRIPGCTNTWAHPRPRGPQRPQDPAAAPGEVPLTCDEIRMVWYCSLSDTPLADWHPLRADINWEGFKAHGMCETCLAVGKERFAKARVTVWEELPAVVGMKGGWEEPTR